MVADCPYCGKTRLPVRKDGTLRSHTAPLVRARTTCQGTGRRPMRDLIVVDVAEPNFGAQVGMAVLQVHDSSQCEGQPCCIHNPSDHHMVTWRQNWRADIGIMERFCRHGVGHPDPDDLTVRREGAHHGCDGCCLPANRHRES